MITVTVNIKGLDDSVKLLEKIKQNVNDNRYGLNKVKDYLLKFFSDDVFGSQGAVFGLMDSRRRSMTSLVPSTKEAPGIKQKLTRSRPPVAPKVRPSSCAENGGAV
jgi:hypothetical protein